MSANNTESILKYMKEHAVEMFLMESPQNHYVPTPPEGCFGMRSNKRRIFLQLNNGAVPTPDEIEYLIKHKEFIETPL